MPDEEIIENEVVEEEGLGDKLKKLREELKLCHKEKSEYLAGWQRAKADFINARKDEEKARAEFAKFAAEKVLGAGRIRFTINCLIFLKKKALSRLRRSVKGLIRFIMKL